MATLIDARLAGLVHDSVSEESGERGRHERFLISRLATGAVTMAMLPPYLLWRGVPSLIETALVVCLLLPVVAAIALARTGRLTTAHILSSAAHAGLVVCLAHLSGGSASPACMWLVMVPIEALMAGTHRAAILAAGFSAAGAVAIALMGPASEPLLGWPPALAMPIFAILAICHVLSLAIEYRRREGSWSDRLRAASARNALLLDVVDDLVTWHDRNGSVLQASRGAVRLAGAAPQTLLGRGMLARVHVSDRPAFLKAISDAALLDGPVTVQFRLHADVPASSEPSRVIWAEMRAHRVPLGADAASAPGQAAVVAVTRDVSEHYRHAAELDRARAEAERADAVKSRFLAVVSHELRTPLNAIIGFSEMLSAGTDITLPPERQREYATIIQNSGRHLLEVVNALLDLTKIQSGSFDFAPEPFDLRALVNGCCDLMQLRADQGGVELLRDVPRDLPELTADPRACRQMLINLLSNAVKFTPRGGRITVSVREAFDRVEFSVTDTGIGIAEADLPRLGDPFFQAGDPAAYARMHEGTGLGLSVVRGLVGLHDGEMMLESSVARGTRVVVALPLDCRGGPRAGQPVAIRTAPLPEAAAVPLLRAS
ncbi:ATP-binding protein [Methylobacterium sp. ID0610]